MFIGATFAGTAQGVVNYVNPSPTFDNVTLENMYLDEIWATNIQPVDHTGSEWDNMPTWTHYTELRCSYKEGLNAGNLHYLIENVQAVKIKRRFADDITSDWQPIYMKSIKEKVDFNVAIVDYLEPSNRKVEYLYCPVAMNGSDYIADGEVMAKVYSKFNFYVLVDKDYVYKAIINAITTPNMNVPLSVVETLGNKYPFVIRKGAAAYRSGTMTALYMEINCCGSPAMRSISVYDKELDEYVEKIAEDLLDVENAWKHRNEVENFIANGNDKLIKAPDGDIWLTAMSAAPSRNVNNDYRFATTSFGWTEVGDAYNSIDLYNSNLLTYDGTLEDVK